MRLAAAKGNLMETLNAYLATFLPWLVKATLQGSLLVCLIMLIQVTLRERLPARWRYCLWLVLLLRLSLPWSPQSPVSIYRLYEPLRWSQPAQPASTRPSAQISTNRQDRGMEQTHTGIVVDNATAPRATVAPAPDSERRSSALPSAQEGTTVVRRAGLMAALPVLWLIGVIGLGSYILGRSLWLWQAVVSERPVTDQQILDLLEDCKMQMRVKTIVGVVVTDKTGSPALFGFLRPRILLPQGLLEGIGLDELQYVFLHELAHLKRRDIYLAWLVCLLQILHWFNPLIWYAFRRMRADQEMAADALALATAGTGESRRYGHTIVSLLGRFSRPQYVPSLAGILENRSHIERRIKMIAEYKGSTRRPLLAVMLLAVLGLMTLTDAQTNKSDVSKSTADEGAGRRQPVIQTLVTGGAVETAGVLCPDESMIAYVDWDNPDGSAALMVKELASGQRHVLAESELIESTGDHAFAHPVVWSPDSKWLAYGWHGKHADLRIGAVPSGPSRILKAHDPEVEYAPEDWSSDGEWLLCVLAKKGRNHALGMVSVAGGHHEELASFGESRPVHARFSPDGKWVVYECTSGGNPDVYVMEVRTKQIRRLTDWSTEESSPVWSLDGNHIVFSSNRRGVWDLLEIPMELGLPKGEPRLLKYDFGAYPKRVTRTGNIAFNVAISSMDVYSLDVNPQTGESLGQPVRLTKSFYGQYLRPAWSPDGRRIAYIRQAGWTLCIQTIATGQEECISTGMWPANQIFWSPDGEAVALTPRSKDGRTGVFYFSLSARQLRPIVLCPNFSPQGFTPDGKEFVLYRPGEEPGNIAVDIETGNERKLALPEGFNSWTYDFSRDQARIAFVESEPNGPEKLVVSDRDFEDKHTVAQAKAINQPRWSPDGTKIAFLCNYDDESFRLHMVAADGSWQTKVDTGQFKIVFPPAWSPDSRKLALTLSAGEGSVSEIAVIENPFPESAGQTVGGTGSKTDPRPSEISSSPATPAKLSVTMRLVDKDSTGYASVSPDGKYLCDVDIQGGMPGEHIVLREFATGEKRRIKPTKGTPDESGPMFSLVSPEGKTIAYGAQRDRTVFLRLIGTDGSGQRDICSGVYPIQWFPDGRRILGCQVPNENKTMSIVSVSISDGSIHKIKTAGAGPWVWGTRLSPDARYVAYGLPAEGGSDKQDIFVVEIASGQETSLVHHSADDKLLGWTPDGRHLLFASDRMGSWDAWLLPVAEGKAQGLPKLVARNLGEVAPKGFTQNGSYYYEVAYNGDNVYTAAIDMVAGQLLAAPAALPAAGNNGYADWSPDGQSLAYCSYPEPARQPHIIRIRSLATGEERELFHKLPMVRCLSWCPDGRSVLASWLTVFGAGQEEWPGRVCRVDMGTGDSTVVLQTDSKNGGIWRAELSPDEKTLFYSQGGAVFRRQIAGGEQKSIYDLPEEAEGGWITWALSPTAEFIAVGFNEPTKEAKEYVTSIVVVPSGGGEITELLRRNEPGGQLTAVAWSRDSTTVLTTVQRNFDTIEFWQVPTKGSQPRKITEAKLGWCYSLRVHPDGQRIAFMAGHRRHELWVMENFLPVDRGGSDAR